MTPIAKSLPARAAPYCSPTMRQFLRDLGAGKDPIGRFVQPHGRLAAETVAALRSRGWLHQKSITLTDAGREYLADWCNLES